MIRTQTLILLFSCAFLFPHSISSAQAEKPESKSASAPPDASAGKRMFERHCALCHGIDGKGGRGPNLNRAKLFHAPDDAALKSLIFEGIFPEMPEAWFFSEEEISNIAAYVRSLGKIPAEPLPGDAARGGTIFTRNSCLRCHLFAGAGFAYGPDLTGLGERRSPAYVRNAIATPAEHLPEGFLLVRVITASGRTIEGVRMNEDTFTIQIRDASGTFHSLRKQELKDLQKLRGQSPMPPYKTILSPAELDDLIAYLFSARGPQ
jgi:cytochrome c oxidase cbb3-type subunit III